MKYKVLIVGGGNGLGSQLARLLVEENIEIHVLTRSCPIEEVDNVAVTRHQADLQHLDNAQIDELGSLMASMDATAFCQRYRKARDDHQSSCEDALDEYQVCIQSTALMIEKMIEKIRKNSDMNLTQRPKQLLLVGSTYTSYAGFDQDWSYHAVKSALHGLVRYFAIRSNGLYAINMISPPTFMKSKTEDYWNKTEKYNRWKNYPSKSLPTANDIAELAKVILLSSSRFINGQNIVCDGGASCLYLDQQVIS